MTSNQKAPQEERSVILIDYPKIIHLYPTFIGSLLAGFVESFVQEEAVQQIVGWCFLWLFALNVVVLAFEFPRTTSLTLFFLLMATVLGLILLAQDNPNLLPAIYSMLKKIRPEANATFYYGVALIFAVIYVLVVLAVQFDYWEVRSNELLHHHGFLSSLERFPAPNLRVTKEIDDVFEYLLCGSGRLVLHPSNEPRSFTLDNVPFVRYKEKQITQMLSSLKVKIQQEQGAHPTDPS